MVSESKEIQWRKIGGGSLRYIRNKIIKPNEVFIARPEEIPLAFRRQVVALEDVPETMVEPVRPFTVRKRKSSLDTKAEVYKVQQRSTNGWWDVVNSVSGKIINEKGLREEAAQQLVKELNA